MADTDLSLENIDPDDPSNTDTNVLLLKLAYELGRQSALIDNMRAEIERLTRKAGE